MLSYILKIQALWSKEWILKIISLCLATLLWYFVGGQDMIEKNILVPVEIINMPNDLIISNKYKKEIEVTVKGPKSVIFELGKTLKPRQIDLSDASPGTRVEDIETDSIRVSRGIEVQRVRPSSIILSLDKLVTKEFPVNAVTVGDVTPGYILTGVQVEPPIISITGSQTVLSQFDVLNTVPINIDGLFESAQLQIPLNLQDNIIDLIGETSVTVDINVDFDTVEKTYKKLPVKVVEDGFIKKTEPSHVDVTLKIPKIIIDKKTDLMELFTVTATSFDESESMKVQVILSSSLNVPLEVISIVPGYVKILSPDPGESPVQDKL